MNGNHRVALGRRSGFTLIELLVVIAIIAVLSGLLLAGVMMVLRTGPVAATRNDILQLNTGLEKFKADNGFYPPNQIKLCSNYAMYNPTGNALDRQSMQIIARMYKNLGVFTGINWANRTGPTAPVFGSAANPTTDILEGDQCLVFFLGGPPQSTPPVTPGLPGLMGGWSTNPLNPVDGTVSMKKYFDFASGRLTNRVTAAYPAPDGHPFPSYMDPFGKKQVFVYFSSNDRPEGYDLQSPYGVTPVNSLGLSPFFSQAGPPRRYVNPNSYQIISAGEDGLFGAGGLWSQGVALGANSRDDLANFSDKALGLP